MNICSILATILFLIAVLGFQNSEKNSIISFLIVLCDIPFVAQTNSENYAFRFSYRKKIWFLRERTL